MFEMFIDTYGMEILYTVVIALFGYLGMQAKAFYEQYINTKEKQAVAETVCKAVEQIYKDLSGEEKKQMALQNIEAMLAEKGITITVLEMEMLIEAAVFGFKQGTSTEVKTQDTEYEIISETTDYTEAVAKALKEVSK